MARFFGQTFLDELLGRVDIVEVVSSYVHLERRGGNYWGRCPFHNEKTPSFSVNTQRQMYYCFGCHKGGDAIRFVQEMERVEFPDAVAQLAERAGMELPQEEARAARHSGPDREALYDACRRAALYFYRNLYSPEGAEALAYLHKRGVSDAMIKRFGLGYAPPQGSTLLRALQAEGVDFSLLQQTCLAMEKDGRRFDFFRNRVMFPIIDRRGHVLGFGGRVMDGSQPKYLNTPETVLYKKRDNLYAINLLHKLRQCERALIVEGYMDVVSLHAVGIPYAVASLGTALTENQARLISRYTKNVYIGYDGDAAGQAGMLRGLDILRAAGLQVKVLRLPDGLDPDDFARTRGAAGVADALENALPLNDYVIGQLQPQFDLTTPDGRGAFVSRCCQDVLRKLQSPVEYDIYKKMIARMSGVSETAIDEETGRVRARADAAPAAPTAPQRLDEPRPQVRRDPAADTLLYLALTQPALREDLLLDPPALLTQGDAGALLQAMQAAPTATAQALLPTLGDSAAALVTRLLVEERPEGENHQQLYRDCRLHLKKQELDGRIRAINDELRENRADEAQRQALRREQWALIQQKQALQDGRNAR